MELSISISRTDNYFVGLSDEDVERVFRWPDGNVLTYPLWRSTQPNSKYDQNCVEVKSTGVDDSECYKPIKYLCSDNNSK